MEQPLVQIKGFGIADAIYNYTANFIEIPNDSLLKWMHLVIINYYVTLFHIRSCRHCSPMQNYYLLFSFSTNRLICL